MPVVINTNTTATTASYNLSSANASLRKSLARLSSGKRINSPADDAGGLAVSYKIHSKTQRTEKVMQNVQNSLSFLQMQDSGLTTVGKILDRMSELRVMAQDVTKNSSDIENYSKEFVELQSQLKQIKNETFNGISLFSSGDVTVTSDPTLNKSTTELSDLLSDSTDTIKFKKYGRTLYTHPGGQTNDGSISINVVNLEYVLQIGKLDDTNRPYWDSTNTKTSYAGGVNLGDVEGDQKTGYVAGNGLTSGGFVESIMAVSVGAFTNAIEKLADARAENGSEQNRAMKVMELLSSNMINLEAAYGRIMDADIALESTRFARHNILVQSGAAMTAQANQLSNVALSLIG
jgi:flagellin